MDTRQKYNEAEYFLEMMKENIEDRQKFKYNLSAFLSAARSVTFVLQDEFSKNRDFDEWYYKKQMKMKRDELLKFFNKKRISVIHKKGSIDTQAEIRETINVEVFGSVSVEAIVRNSEGTIKDYEYFEPPVKSKISPKQDNIENTEYKWFFRNCPEKFIGVDVITLSEKCLKELKVIVDEAESIFGEAKDSQKQSPDK